METPEIIKKIDWTDLRTQKTLLLQTINNKAVSPMHKEGLEGILALIDALQDYAVDEMDIDPMHVFDYEQEDVRDGYVGIEPTMSEEKTIPVDKFLAFVNDEDNHTEGELGNSCIDVQTLIHQFTDIKDTHNNPIREGDAVKTFLVIEMFGGIEHSLIVTDEDGNNKVFHTYEEAQLEADECQDGVVVEIK